MIIELTMLAVAAMLYWAWKTRDPQAMRISDVLAVVAALIGLKMLDGHSPLGLVGLGAACWWLWLRTRGRAGKRNPGGMTADEARRLLEVPVGAGASEIRSAHRRLIARVHPDTGGSADLARRVNAARDILLKYQD